MKWTLQQCESQAAGIATLERLKESRALTKQEKQTLAIAKSHYNAYGCKKTISSQLSRESLASSSSVSASEPLTNRLMPSILDTVSTAVGSLTGRSTSTTAPVAGERTPGALESLGTAIGGNLGTVGAALGGVLGTLGDSAITSRTSATTTLPGRSNASDEIVINAGPFSVVRWGSSRTEAIKKLLRWFGLEQTSALTGATPQQIAYVVTRPRRRRGITAASIRTTKRVIRQINSLNHQLSKIHHRAPARRRTPC